MNDRASIDRRSIRTASEQELRLRRDVALGYRLIARFGFDDLTDGFVSARLPGEPHALFGGYGRLPALVTASSLHRRPIEGEIALEKAGGVDVDARCFARMIYGNVPDAGACIHAHPLAVMVFSALETDFAPISQYAFMFAGKIAAIPFLSGDVSGGPMKDAIVDAVQSGAKAILLKNHGTLVYGRTVAEAFWWLYRLEQTCRIQIEAMKTGASFATPAADALRHIQKTYLTEDYVDYDGSREWDELARAADRTDPSWRD